MSVVIADWVRTPLATSKGQLSKFHSVELGTAALRFLLERASASGSMAELLTTRSGALVVGCANPIGEQSMNVASALAAAADLSQRVTTATVDCAYSSGLRALFSATAMLKAGDVDFAIVVGLSSASRVAVGSVAGLSVGRPFGPELLKQYGGDGGLKTSGELLQELADRFGISRVECDDWAKESRRKAPNNAGRLTRIAPVASARGGSVNADCVAMSAAIEDLPPLFVDDGVLTAATFPVTCDGATAMLLTRSDVVDATGCPAIVGQSSRSSFNVSTTGVDAFSDALDAASLSVDRLGGLCVHEDSAVTPLAFMADVNRRDTELKCVVNQCGGVLGTGDLFGVGALLSLQFALDDCIEVGGYSALVSAGAGGHQDALIFSADNNGE